MEQSESQEIGSRETRGRQPKMIAITVQLPASDHASLLSLMLKRMKQFGEDVPRDRIISEAIQCLVKAQAADTAGQ